MMNQDNKAIMEEVLQYPYQLDTQVVKKLLLLTIRHLELEAVRTNATKHGNEEIVLRPST